MVRDSDTDNNYSYVICGGSKQGREVDMIASLTVLLDLACLKVVAMRTTAEQRAL